MRYNDNYILYKCSKLKNLYVDDEVPVQVLAYPNPFKDVSQSAATLYVPVGTKELYQNATCWKQFGTIAEMDFTAVPNIRYTEPAEVRCYDTIGRRTKVDGTAKGLTIERWNDGTIRKVLTRRTSS